MPLKVNADDFGKDEAVNRAICEAFANGYIDTTTLMVNMPGADEAYKLASVNGFTGRVGIHLNLTEGMPLTTAIRNNPLICAPDGSFNAAFYHNTKYRLYMDDQSVDMIREELDAQIALFLDMGFKNLHIDSHHHVHTNYPVYRAIKQLKSRYDYAYIRLSRNLYRGGSPFNAAYKVMLNSALKHLAPTSRYFGSYRDLLEYFSIDPGRPGARAGEMPPAMKRLISGSEVEIMVHPLYNAAGVLVDTDIPMNEEQRLLKPQMTD
ncbi:MAG: ChbG/HpnK family deacetylase [Lachnospiraceae bacterium]|nr:ChbG/HpnK family deacetylase [Lachnospiraceae bacterium]